MNETLSALQRAQDSLSKNLMVKKASPSNPGVPPSSLMTFLKKVRTETFFSTVGLCSLILCISFGINPSYVFRIFEWKVFVLFLLGGFTRFFFVTEYCLQNPEISSLVLEDFDSAFSNKFYHSHLDDLC